MSGTAPERLRPRGWTITAWAVAGLGWALAAAAVTMLILTGRAPQELSSWVMDLVVAVVYGATVVVLLPRARHPVVWIVAATAVGCALAAFAEFYAALDGSLPGQHLAFYGMYWAWMPGTYATVAIMPFLVLGGRSAGRTALVGAAAAATVLATLRGVTVVVPGLPPNPLGVDVDSWQSLIRDAGLWPDRAVAAIGAVAVGWLLRRRRQAAAEERPGLTWLVCGQSAMVAAMAVFLWPVASEHAEVAAAVSGALLLLAQAFLPVALLVLVLGRQLWGIDATISRTAVWLVMTAGVALAYLLVVGGATVVMPHRSELVLAVAVVLVGLGFAPLRAAVQRRVDRLVYGTSADADWWSLDTTGAYDLDGLADSLRRGLGLSDVRLLPVDPTGELPSITVTPHDSVLPLISRGRVVGALVAVPRPGERLDRRTSRMLEQVAALAATTLDLMQSNEALDAARSRLVSIRHEERRVLRRDLHDGLGPALAGIRLGLSASRNLRERDPDAAEAMLDELQVELSRRSEDIRRMSRSLLPPALDEGDLRVAMESLVARFAEGLSVRLDVPDDIAADPHQQVALYHIAGEAMLNVHRHAQARSCEVLVRRDEDGLLLVVADDGIGLTAARTVGIGMRSMRERAEDLGGTVEVTGVETGGTRVTVRLPARLASR